MFTFLPAGISAGIFSEKKRCLLFLLQNAGTQFTTNTPILKRRKFIKLSALTAFGAMSGCERSDRLEQTANFEIELQTDFESGHRLLMHEKLPVSRRIRCEILVVGGGLAGLSAARTLRKHEVQLCELSETLGGTAAGGRYQNIAFSQGAHYEIDYPTYFGEDVPKMLEALDIMQYAPSSKLWKFKNRHFLVNPARETQSYHKAAYQQGVLPRDTPHYEKFMALANKYVGKLPLPTPQIAPAHRHLNTRYFADFLAEQMPELSDQFRQGIDYQMIDDFGADSRQVSALAGLFYYAGRPYHDPNIETFSPPEGNAYFVRKIAESFPKGVLNCRQLVRKITPEKRTFKVDVLALSEGKLLQYEANKIVYAGQKHALKFVFPPDYPLFKHNLYAPWMVINFVIEKNALPSDAYWQNEIPTAGGHFLGFVDSAAHHRQQNYRILTAYYCFPPWKRKLLAAKKEKLSPFVFQALNQIARYFRIEPKKMRENIKKVFLKPMGHAMPIPVPNYLFDDKNLRRSHPKLVYAGVDNSRLPLLFEALDSGIAAANLLSGLPE